MIKCKKAEYCQKDCNPINVTYEGKEYKRFHPSSVGRMNCCTCRHYSAGGGGELCISYKQPFNGCDSWVECEKWEEGVHICDFSIERKPLVFWDAEVVMSSFECSVCGATTHK